MRKWLNVWGARLRALRGREAVIRDIDEELRAHVEMETEANLRRGLPPGEARRRAMLSFGNYDSVRGRAYEVRGGGAAETLWQDARYAARMLRKRPGFTAVAVLTLALGIGANTAIFSVVNGVLLKSLPLPEPERLVVLSETSQRSPSMAVSYQNYLDWRARQTVFEGMAARVATGGVMTGEGEPERIVGRQVTASFFPTLGVRPAAGRFFTDEEDRPGAAPVMVLGHALWQRRFGADPAVVGRRVIYNGSAWTVVGVTPPDFDFYGAQNANNDFFIPLGPLAVQGFMRDRSSHALSVTARLRPGVTIEQARAEMRSIAEALAREHPASNEGQGVALSSLLDDYVGEVRPALLTVSGAVLLVLLIACANVANLLLARAPSRRKEMAVRTALGASRARVVRQLLVESLLLAAAGGAAGLLLAWWGVDLLVRLHPDGVPRLEEIAVDARVLAFTLTVTFVTAVVCGLAPALQTSKVNLGDALKEGGRRASGGPGSKRLGHALVVAEVAVSLVLLVGAGLLVESFRRLTRVDAGFEPRGVLTLRLRLPDAKYREGEKSVAFLREALRRVEALPGVEAASLATGFPLGRGYDQGYALEGEPEPQRPDDWAVAVSQAVSEGYFKALGVRLLAGRNFDGRDAADAPPVVVVDEEFARRHSPASPFEGVLGKRLRFGGEGEPWREVVGVVGRVRHYGLEQEARAGVYRPWTQISPRSLGDYTRAMDVVVKTRGEPEALVPAVRREVRALDPDLPLANVRTLQSLLDQSLAPRRFSASLVGAFALVALALGAVGLYGVMSYAVSQRTHEIGIRMALGAPRGRILRGVLGQGMALVSAGVGLGLAGALAAARLIAGQLYGVTPADPATILGVAALLVAVALAACYVPARRATKVDPLTALRYE